MRQALALFRKVGFAFLPGLEVLFTLCSVRAHLGNGLLGQLEQRFCEVRDKEDLSLGLFNRVVGGFDS